MMFITVLLAMCLFTSVTCDDEFSDSTKVLNRMKRNLHGQKFKVVYILRPPYVTKSDDGSYQGFIVDLMKELSQLLRFDIEEYLVPDHRYGSTDDQGNWDGMIKEILDHDKDPSKGADIAAAALTITSAREAVVDFLKPFQHVGLAVMIKKPPKARWSMLHVMQPFSPEVLVLIIISFIVVSLVIWGMNYANPYEWGPRYQRGVATESQGSLFNLPGSLWYAFSTMQWQGYERSPRSMAAKVLSCFWFMFVTVTLIMYTSGLLNMFIGDTIVRNSQASPIPSLEDLVNDNRYSYGVLMEGSSYNYIMNNKFPVFERMAAYLRSAKGQRNLVATNADGVERIRTENNYAFILEDTAARFMMNKYPCDLMIGTERFAPRSYGMAISQHMNPNITDMLERGLLELHEGGVIEALEKKWWYELGDCTSAQSNTAVNITPTTLTLQDFWGPLVLLLVGIILSVLVCVAEILYYRYRGQHQADPRPNVVLKMDDDQHNEN